MFRFALVFFFAATLGQLSPSLSSGGIVVFGSADAQMQFGGTIQGIDVRGNQRFSDQAVIAQSGMAVGDPFDPFLLNDSLKALFETGNYEDVNFSRTGNTLIITVVETQFVNRIFFEGNDAYSDSDLAGFIGSKPTDPFSRPQLQQDVNIILAAYAEKGRYQAKVTPKTKSLGNGRVDITFNIQEGPVARVGSVNFVGNESYSDATLRRVVSSKQQTPLRGVTSGDRYTESRLRADEEALTEFYMERGFADFRVVASQGALASDQSGFVVTFAIEEGPRYTVSGIRIETEIEDLDTERLAKNLSIRTGRLYKRSLEQASAEEIREEAENMGFGTAVVETDRETDPDKGTLVVVYTIEEGPRVTIERIEIRGNLRTRDYVIRREMRLAEGDGFSVASLRRSLQRIRNLGYFKNANIKTENGSSSDQTVVVVEVEEGPTGSLNFGGGLSSANGATVSLEYREINLLGRGQKLNVGLEVGDGVVDFNAGFQEPWFLGREIGAGGQLFYKEIDNGTAAYALEEYGLRLNMNYKLSERLSQGWSYTAKRTDVSNVTSTSPAILDQAGITDRSILGHNLSYNRLDSTTNPRDGFFLAMSNDMAGNGLGGDVDWLKTTVRGSYYIPMGEFFTLRLRGQAGAIESLNDDPVPLTDRFYQGQSLVRGFEPTGLGPRTNADGEAVGATTYYGASVELFFPFPGLADSGVVGRVFVDAGSAFDQGPGGSLDFGSGATAIDDSELLRTSYGVGVTWNSPFGPINLDWAVPADIETFDVEQNFQFSFGVTL